MTNKENRSSLYRSVKVTNNKTGLSFTFLASDKEVWDLLGLERNIKSVKR